MYDTSTAELPAIKEFSSIGAENNPNRVAFSDWGSDREVTWAEYDDESRRAANAFREYVGQGDRVAFVCEDSVDHVTLWNGALKAGCVATNLHARASPDTYRYCIDTVRPDVLVLDEEFSEFVEERVYGELSTDLDAVVTLGEPRADYEQSLEAFVADRPRVEPDVRVRPGDVAAIVWTSGTTGRPKGWCHTNRSLAVKALKGQSMLGISRSTKFPIVFTPSFGAWYAGSLPAMLANASTYYMRSWDPEEMVRLIEGEGLTEASLVTTMWRDVLALDDLEEYDLSSLESIVSTGEKLDATTLRRLEKNVCETVTNGYASTEVIGTMIEHEEMEGDRIGSVGKPVGGTRVRIVEEGGSPEDTLPPGELGEIVIKGADRPAWVWGDTAKTNEEFEDGWWHSGDLGYKDEDGYLFLEGRDDFMINSKGIKVFPVPVEERLANHPGVAEAAVIGVEDEEYGEMVTAIVRRSDPDVTAEDLDEWCLGSDELARYERPREYHFVDEPLPRTPSGKLDRHGAGERIE